MLKFIAGVIVGGVVVGAGLTIYVYHELNEAFGRW